DHRDLPGDPARGRPARYGRGPADAAAVAPLPRRARHPGGVGPLGVPGFALPLHGDPDPAGGGRGVTAGALRVPWGGPAGSAGDRAQVRRELLQAVDVAGAADALVVVEDEEVV